ncbi:MAG: glycoside hydrolase family 13 protein [Treponema sp.]
MNTNAIIHHAYDNFCYPLNEDELEISILTGKDVERVTLIFGDPFLWEMTDGQYEWKSSEVEMTEKKELSEHLRWSVTVKPPFKRARYYFTLSDGANALCYLESGVMTDAARREKRDLAGYFTFPWMNEADICRVPLWAAQTVWYQIFPARFCRGSTPHTPERLKTWAAPNEKVENSDAFGGNLQGIIDKLDYLEALGIGGIYLTPVNSSPSQHKYDTTDYLTVDPSFGTGEQLRELVDKAHAHSMKVMLDGVFNHSGRDFFAWQDVLKRRKKSQYASWFLINDFHFDLGAQSGGQKGNAEQGKFYSFAFVDGMPKLNTNNPHVREYLIGVCERWIADYDIDGIRFDVANELSHAFCKEVRARLKAIKPDFYLMGEIWHNALPWLRGDEFDSVMNYPLLNAVVEFCTDDRMTAKQFEYAVNRCYSRYFRQVNRVLFNQMDSHDTVRIVTRCGGSKKRAALALALCFCMPGSPCLYYGTEVFLEGGGDPDNRRCMPWKEIESGLYDADIAAVKALIRLRTEHAALRSANMRFIYETPSAAEGRLLYIERISGDGERLFLIVNASDTAQKADALVNAEILLQSGSVKDGVIGANEFAFTGRAAAGGGERRSAEKGV